MSRYDLTKNDSIRKWKYAFWGGVLFSLLSLPLTYGIINQGTVQLLNLPSVSPMGVPTFLGVVVTSILFILIMRLLMR